MGINLQEMDAQGGRQRCVEVIKQLWFGKRRTEQDGIGQVRSMYRCMYEYARFVFHVTEAYG